MVLPPLDEGSAMSMELTSQQIAEAFSRHDFEASYAYLAEDIRWNIVGERQVEGKEDVISVCRESAAYLTGLTTNFGKFRSIVTDDCVVIDSVAEYIGKQEERSRVASCDLYDFANGKVSEITSYTVEI
jgi:hypothetical protein